MLFFILLTFAALTSSISLLEPTVELLEEKTPLSRKAATAVAASAACDSAGNAAVSKPPKLKENVRNHFMKPSFRGGGAAPGPPRCCMHEHQGPACQATQGNRHRPSRRTVPIAGHLIDRPSTLRWTPGHHACFDA